MTDADEIVVEVEAAELLALRDRAESRGDALVVSLVDLALGGDKAAAGACLKLLVADLMSETNDPA